MTTHTASPVGVAPESPASLDTAITANNRSAAAAVGGGQAHHACAACKHQRRKCTPECPLAPYFPANMADKFINAQRIFGVSNIVKFINSVSPDRRRLAVDNLIFHSEARRVDPVNGVVGVIAKLRNEIQAAERERDFLRRQLQEVRLRERSSHQVVMKLEGSAESSSSSPPVAGPVIQLHPKSPTIFHLPVEEFEVKDMKKPKLSPVCDAEYMDVKSSCYRSPNPRDTGAGSGSGSNEREALGYCVECNLGSAYSPNVIGSSSQEAENGLASSFLYKS